MNNGLNGRYGKGLESWNQARRLSADLIEVFDVNYINRHRPAHLPEVTE